MGEENNDETLKDSRNERLKTIGFWSLSAILLCCGILNRPFGIYNVFYIIAAVAACPPIIKIIKTRFGKKALPVVLVALAVVYLLCSVLNRTYFDSAKKSANNTENSITADLGESNAKTYTAKSAQSETPKYEYICFERLPDGSARHRVVTSETDAEAQKKIYNEFNQSRDEGYILWLFSVKQKAMLDDCSFDLAELKTVDGEIVITTPEEYAAEQEKQEAEEKAAEAEREKAAAAAASKSETTTSSTGSSGAQKTQTPAAQNAVGNIVYATPSGSRYHLKSTCGGSNSSQIALDEALKRDLTPCKKCANG